MRGGMNSNRYEISFLLKISLRCSVNLYLCSHELRRNETRNSMDFRSVILTEMKFQTGMRFSCEHNLPETKWISADSLNVAFETQCGYGFYIGHFDRNEISFLAIKYHVNTTRNKIHQNIRSFWNAAKMKLEYVNRTCFHAGLKSQTGMSSFRLSYERTLRESLLLGLLVHFSQFSWS